MLDLFAGSGALGLEMLSRGAASAEFVERDPRTIRVLEKNIDALGARETATVYRDDAVRFVESVTDDAYDIVVADPPYAGEFGELLATLWLQRPFSRILSVEHNAHEKLPGSGDTRRYGTSAITFYRREE